MEQALTDEQDFDFETVRPRMVIIPRLDSTATEEQIAARETHLEERRCEYNDMIKKWNTRKEQYRTNKTKATGLLWQQCSSGMRAKLQERSDFHRITKNEPGELLKAIKEQSMSYQSSQYKMKTVVDAIKMFVTTRQRIMNH